MNLTSIPYADGSGYIAVVDVFHQLHCLVSILESAAEVINLIRSIANAFPGLPAKSYIQFYL